MSISRWDPIGDLVSLREAMNNLLEESVVRPRAGAGSGGGSLALDLRETPDSYVLTTAVPGVQPDDVDITILGDTLRIRAEHRDQAEQQPKAGSPEAGRWLLRERRYGSFERVVALPTAVKADQATADFKDGVLTITLPKAEEAKPRAIKVRSGGERPGGQIAASSDQGGQSRQGHASSTGQKPHGG